MGRNTHNNPGARADQDRRNKYPTKFKPVKTLKVDIVDGGVMHNNPLATLFAVSIAFAALATLPKVDSSIVPEGDANDLTNFTRATPSPIRITTT